MGRRGRISPCASCALLGFAIVGMLGPTAVRADIADAMPAFRPHTVMGVPRCAANEELCPVSKGSNELHCIDLTDAKTCGGCVTDGDGLDCTSVPGVFMQQCTARGQCTGCRWKYGGMNASLEQPDFLSCSIILTQPVQASRHVPRRAPRLSFAKQLLKHKFAHSGPMAARKPQANYAADQAVAKHLAAPAHGKIAPLVPLKGAAAGGLNELPPPHVLQAQREQMLFGNGQRPGLQPLGNAMLQPHRGSTKQDDHIVKRDSFPAFELSEIPDPPVWLTAFTSSHLSNLPLTDKDDAILAWFQSLHDGIVKLAVKFHAMSPKEEKKKISNADRFRLKLPPVAPKGLVRPNKPAPFILPGMDYTEEEIEAMGLKDYIQTKTESRQEEEEETVTVHDRPSVFWGRLMKTAFRSTAKNVRSDVMDALWLLLDEVSQPASDVKKPAAPRKAPAQPRKKEQKGGPNVFLPQDRKKAPAKLAGKPLEAATVGAAPGREQQALFGLQEAENAGKAKGAAVQPALEKRPGHLAADTPKKPVAEPAKGGGLTDPLVPLAHPVPNKPKPLLPVPKGNVPAAVKADAQPARGFLPEIANGRLGSPPGFVGDDAGLPKGSVPPIVNGQLGSPPQGKTNLLAAKKQAIKPQQVPVENVATGDEAPDSAEADPYARERQRPAPKAKAAEAEDGFTWEMTLNVDGTISKVKKPKSPEDSTSSDAEEDASDQTHNKESDTISPAEVLPETEIEKSDDDTPSDDETLMKLLAAKQQEMVEIQKKIAQRKQRKQAAMKDKPIPAKKILEDARGVRFREGLLKGPKAVKAQAPLQPQLPKKLLKPLQPAVARQGPPIAAGNEFEQHIRQAQQAKFLKLEDQVQPEKLLETLESEQLAQGGEDVAGSGKKRPMMAGMAKARPGAHMKPDSNTGRGLRR